MEKENKNAFQYYAYCPQQWPSFPRGLPQCMLGHQLPPPQEQTPLDQAPTPLCGQTHACKNITFATSLRTVKMRLTYHFPLFIWMNSMLCCLINLHGCPGCTNRVSEGSCRIVMCPTQLHLGENICLLGFFGHCGSTITIEQHFIFLLNKELLQP